MGRSTQPIPSLFRELRECGRDYCRFILFLIIAGSVCVLLLLFFLYITSQLDQTIWFGFDYYINLYVHAWRSSELTSLMTFITNLGSPYAYVMIIPIIMVILFLKGKNWKLSLQSTIVLVSTFLLNVAIKWIIGRPRPFESQRLIDTNFYSYPSGHAMSATGFYGFLIYLVIRYVDNKWLRIVLVSILTLLITLIGMSRIYLGVHYPTDVLAGFVAGTFWLLICIMVFRSVKFFQKKPLDPNANQ